MTYSEFEDKIRDWVVLFVPSEVLVVFANEPGPRPTIPYITIMTTSFTKIGQTNIISSTEGNESRKYDEDVNVSIQCFGSQWRDLLQKLKDSLQTNDGRKYFSDNCISIREDSGIEAIPILIDTTIEKRGIYEIVCGFARELTDNVGYVEQVTINETYKNPDGSIVDP